LKRSDNVLIEKKKREIRPELKLWKNAWYQFETKGERVIHRWNSKSFSLLGCGPGPEWVRIRWRLQNCTSGGNAWAPRNR